jgi:hypothetical protein
MPGFLHGIDTGGNENVQFFFTDTNTSETRLLTDGVSMNRSPIWNSGLLPIAAVLLSGLVRSHFSAGPASCVSLFFHSFLPAPLPSTPFFFLLLGNARSDAISILCRTVSVSAGDDKSSVLAYSSNRRDGTHFDVYICELDHSNGTDKTTLVSCNHPIISYHSTP